jgi:uncharacterized RDD family membrane protein YckC
MSAARAPTLWPMPDSSTAPDGQPGAADDPSPEVPGDENSPEQSAEGAGRQPAGFGRRLGALVIDSVLAVMVAAAFTYPAAPRLWSAAVLIVSYTFFTGLFSQTIGMRLLGIGVVDVISGRPIGLVRAAVRTLLLQLVLPAAILDRYGRGWHDRATRSIVLR